MKFYEAPDFTKIEFFTEEVLGDSILDVKDDDLGGTSVEVGKIPLFN